MDASAAYELLRTTWVVAAMAVFVLIVLWAMWPARKAELDRHARIPLDDDR